VPRSAGAGFSDGSADERSLSGLAFSVTGEGVARRLLYATVYVHAEAVDPQVTAISRTMPSMTVREVPRSASGSAASSWATYSNGKPESAGFL
jgi:hypothetical protein